MRRPLTLAAFIVLLAELPTPAPAQINPQQFVPTVETTDSRGVDLVSGQLRLQIPLVSFGEHATEMSASIDLPHAGGGWLPGSPEVMDVLGPQLGAALSPRATTRSGHSQEFGTFDNLSFLNTTGFFIYGAQPFARHYNTDGSYYQNSVGPSHITTFISTDPSASGVYNANGDRAFPGATMWGQIDRIVLANGEEMSFYRDSATVQRSGITHYLVRLRFAVSSRGYAIQYLYMSDDPPAEPGGGSWLAPRRITAYNKSIIYCDESLRLECPAVSALASAQITYDNVAGAATIMSPGRVHGPELSTLRVGPNWMRGIRSSRNSGVAGSARNYQYGYRSHDGYEYFFVTRINDPDGQWDYDYQLDGPEGRVPSSFAGYTNPLGGAVGVTGSSLFGQPERITDELGRATYMTVEGGLLSRYRLMGAELPDLSAILTERDERNNIVRVTRGARPGSGDPDLVVYQAAFPVDCINPRTCNRPSSVTDGNGNVSDYTYAPEHGGILTETGPAPSAGAPRPQIRHTYAQRYAWLSNGAGGYVRAAAPIWVRTQTSVCRTSAATGNPASPCATAADELLTSYDYGPDSGPNNLLLIGQAVSADGMTWRTCYAYDSLGRRISETAPGAALSSCPVSPPTAAAPYTSSTRYDASGRVTGTISPDPDPLPNGASGPLPFRAIRNSYDAGGRLVQVETGTLSGWQSDAVAPADWTGFVVHQVLDTQFDAMDRKIRDTRSGYPVPGTGSPVPEGVTQYSYDPLGRLQCTAVRMNPAAFGSLPTSACTLGAEGSFGPDRITRTIYDAAGQSLQVREGVGTSVEGTNATWTYNLNGQITSVIDGGGNRADLRYDGHGRRVRWVLPAPTGPPSFDDSTPATAVATAGAVNEIDFEAYAYDANNNRTSRSTRSGDLINYSYDALNRLTLRNTPNLAWQDRDSRYTYDNLGRRLTATMEDWGSPWTLSWAYDAFGRVTSETSFYGTKTLHYDLAGRLTRLTWPDAFHVDYDYLDTGELLRVRENGATSGIGVLAAYAYDGLGRRTGITRGNGTATAYGYDGVSRLAALSHDFTSAGADLDLTYTHNPAGQIAAGAGLYSTYVYARTNASVSDAINGLNQIIQTGGTALSHDPRGNITAIGGTGYNYTSDNRLVTVGTTDLAYDAAGRLAIVYTSAQQRFDMLGEAQQLITELDAGNNITRRYIHAPGALSEPLVWYEGSGTSDRRYLHADEHGSIIAISNGSGALSFINAFDEYGRSQGDSLSGRFGYAGQVWLPDPAAGTGGLSHNRARMYNPALGRFMQTDPIGYAGGTNLYEYADGDPINWSDPDGTAPAAIAAGFLFCLRFAPCQRGLVAGLGWIASLIIGDDGDGDRDIPASDRRVGRNDNGGPPDRRPVAAPMGVDHHPYTGATDLICSANISFTVFSWTNDAEIYRRKWSTLSACPIFACRIYQPEYAVNIEGRLFVESFDGRTRRISTHPDERRLSYRNSHSPLIVQDVVQAMNGIGDWRSHYDELLAPWCKHPNAP